MLFRSVTEKNREEKKRLNAQAQSSQRRRAKRGKEKPEHRVHREERVRREEAAGGEGIMGYECCEGVRGLKFSRRYFLKQGGVAMVGLSAMPAFLQRAAAATPSGGKKQLVVLFQRGAADGLNIVVPFGEQNYYRMRPSIAIPRPKSGSRGSGFVLTNPESNGDAAVDLDGFFGLHQIGRAHV